MKKAIILFAVLSTFSSIAQTKHYWLNMPQLNCHKTNESGEDEVYFLVAWKTSKGMQGHLRLPVNEPYHINDTKHEDKPDAAPTTLYIGPLLDFELANNETIDIFCAIMEQDDGKPAQYTHAGEQIVQVAAATSDVFFNPKMPTTFKNILAGIASSNHLDNSDDWIGSFAYRISQSNGALQISFKKISNPQSSGDLAQAGTSNNPLMRTEKHPVEYANSNVSFVFTGDESNYDTRITVTDK